MRKRVPITRDCARNMRRKRARRKLLTLEQARANRTAIDWDAYAPPKPEFLGVRVYASDEISAKQRRQSRQRGRCAPDVSLRPSSSTSIGRRSFIPGSCADVIRRSLMIRRSENRRANFSMTRKNFSNRSSAKNLLVARGVYAFWPANSAGDDVELYTDDARTKKLATFHFLRQQMQKPAGQLNHCLADFVAPKETRQLANLNRRIISVALP